MNAPRLALMFVSVLVVSLTNQVAFSQGLRKESPPNPFINQSQDVGSQTTQAAFSQNFRKETSSKSFTRHSQRRERLTTPSMQFFGNHNVRATPKKEFRRQIPSPQPLQLGGTKPFESIQRLPTLSPYLNLNLRESELDLPNYHAFVRPMQRQQIANQQQAANLRKLQQKVRMATANGIVSNSSTGGVPTTGHSSQFLNLGGYFSDVR